MTLPVRTSFGTPDRWGRRESQRQGEAIGDEVLLTELLIKGVAEVGAYAMRSIREVDAERQTLVRGDQLLNVLLAPIEARTVRDIEKVQAGFLDAGRF
jgi:hypothetical protein